MSTLNHEFDNSLVSNAFGFLRQELVFNPYESDADIVITGVPFDMATSGRAGSRFGPAQIRQVSTNLAWEHCRYPHNYDIREKLKIIDCGDLVYQFGNNQDMVDKLEAHATRLLNTNKKMLTFGGDHFITLPLLRAHAKKYGKLSLIHFDAHADTYSNGSTYDHGTMFYTAPIEGLIDPSRSIQIGIRTEYQESDGFEVIHGNLANDLSVEEIVSKIKSRVNSNPTYLTFDIDCLDPSAAPGTGTPVCGGLTTDKILKILRGLAGTNIVGMDVVEVAPCYDISDITALAGATIALEMLYLQG